MDNPKDGNGNALSGDAAFPDTLNDMPGIALGGAPAGSAFVAAQGAHVLSWRDDSGRERLYLSPASGGMTRSDRLNTQAIRGGIPICFPQFSGRGTLPKHGFVRNMAWLAAPQQTLSGGQQGAMHALTLTCRDDAHTRQIWPQGFAAAVAVQLQPQSLSVTLSVTNTGDTPWEFSVALHTYLRVDDVRNVRLRGLQGVSYQDATAGNVVVTQQEADLGIAAELDRVYLAPPAQLTLLEPGVPSLRIEQHGFADSVVWNPGPLKAAALPDLPDDDWLRMLCVEAACAAVPMRLEPGQSWRGSQILTMLAD
jgi:glucose-6-phosphate 1-epimerase